MFRLHLLHIIQNSWQPLRGLSHSVIIFQKAPSHISTMVVGSCLFLAFVLLSVTALPSQTLCSLLVCNRTSETLIQNSSLLHS